MNVAIVCDRVREWAEASVTFSLLSVVLVDDAGSINRDTEDRDSLFKECTRRRG
jgi:hypothetical protein